MEYVDDDEAVPERRRYKPQAASFLCAPQAAIAYNAPALQRLR